MRRSNEGTIMREFILDVLMFLLLIAIIVIAMSAVDQGIEFVFQRNFCALHSESSQCQ